MNLVEPSSSLVATHAAIIISQPFHIPRIAYLCERQGIDVLAYPAQKGDPSAFSSVWSMTLRESLARVKALFQIHVTKPQGLQFE